MFSPLLLLANPFQQLLDSLSSGIFWIMLSIIVVVGTATYLFFVRKPDRDFGEEEWYFSDQFKLHGIEFINAYEVQVPNPPVGSGSESCSFWKVSGETANGNLVEFDAKVLYRNNNLLDILWNPNLKEFTHQHQKH